MAGTITDASGTRWINGTLPRVLVHDPVGTARLEIRFTDGQAHDIGIEAVGWSLATQARRIGATFGPDGAFSAAGLND